jgi:hypothetical protein
MIVNLAIEKLRTVQGWTISSEAFMVVGTARQQSKSMDGAEDGPARGYFRRRSSILVSLFQ